MQDNVRRIPTSTVSPMKVIGQSTPRIDATERVTGRTQYTRDVFLDGMLYAQVLRSPHPHARIRSIDLSKARALPGVRAIVTHENCQYVWGAGSIAGGAQYNDELKKITRQRRYAFNNPVRYVGEPVAAVAAVDRHVAEEAARLITVDYEVLPFVLDQEAALKDDAVKLWPEGNISLNARNEAAPNVSKRGDLAQGLREADRVFEDRYSTVMCHNAQMEPRSVVAHWEGDKLTVYTPTGGIANCHHDIARDLGMPDEKVRVICHYMGGNFGNKNQNQDTDLITAILAREAGAPVKLEFSRKDDFIGMHGRWPTVQYYKVGVKADGTLTAIQLKTISNMGPYRKNNGGVAGVELYDCAHTESTLYPMYTNRTTSGNFRGPTDPQGYFPIQSLMDDIAYAMKMDPVDFILKNMVKPGSRVNFTNFTLDQCVKKGAEIFEWKKRWKPVPGSDRGPIKRGAGVAFMSFRSGVGNSSAILTVDARGQYTLYVGVTDVGPGAKTTMNIIAADELGVPLSRVHVVWGDTDTCPYSVGESGSRTTIMTGEAVVTAARDLKKQIAEKGMPTGSALLRATASPNPRLEGKVRNCFGAHFVEVEVDTELGSVTFLKYVAVHESGRIMNPLTATSQIKGGVGMGIGMALHENMIYDQRTGIPVVTGYYFDRVPTHLDVPDVDVTFIEDDDGYGPYGAKAVGESGMIQGPAAIGNAIYNAIGRRIKDLPITRDKILGALA
ncbi:MAG: xanthine dehydrogenase family protein molybdopterin-binding subunit [Vicinamibacterales bacterium]